jgi:hypothetical protein
MSDESEHDDLNQALHNAFGAEVADLEIGATPVGAVMKAGDALRTKRRLTTVSGVAALAVLPVAAVAIFAGGTGTGAAEAGGGTHGNGTRTETGKGGAGSTPTTSKPGATTPRSVTQSPSPSSKPTIILPQLSIDANTIAPNPNDVYTVVASGTKYGAPWRLVRDQYVVTKTGNLPTYAMGPHLPYSQKGGANTVTCVFVGLQWGERPAGTQPDFDAGGTCQEDPDTINGPITIGSAGLPGNPGVALWAFIGRVADTTKVASVSVTIPAETTPRQPVTAVAGERDGYYVVFLPPLTETDNLNKSYTTYDHAGHVVDHVTMG